MRNKEIRKCNQGCGTEFIIIKPEKELPYDHIYYTCNHCVAEDNRKKPSVANRYIKEYEKFEDKIWANKE